ncbi:hypothetical protein [Sphingobacterium sp.]|uniref:hypothetical protein n=1 Tax=Sphingobacterium sp. TaxID=341027 RepID=UPI002FDD961F
MKTQITEKQKAQFNLMLEALKAIKAYQSPSKLRKDSEKDCGLEYEEALEMSYENIQATATLACKNIKPLK